MSDDEICIGTPTLTEFKQYWATAALNLNEREVMDGGISSAESVGLSDSFKEILHQRHQAAEEELKRTNQKTPVGSLCKKAIMEKQNKTPFVGRLDDTELEKSDWEPSDETFARMEAMCEDTEEAAAIDRLLGATIEEQVEHIQVVQEKKGFGEMTQIGEIEAPSCLWEQTIMHANSPKASPIKMVGYLRPSTIIEESTVAESTVSTVKEKELMEQIEESKEEAEEVENSVVSINSTDESFITAKADMTEFKTAVEQNSASASSSMTSSNASSTSNTSDLFPKNKRKFFRDSLFGASKVKTEERSENFLDSLDVVELSDDESKVEEPEVEAETEGAEENIDLNNTLERMDYLLKQMKKKPNTTMLLPTITKAATPALEKIQTNLASPKPKASPTFKKPTALLRPLATTAKNNNKFNHIVSPIANYIHNTPMSPQIIRNKTQSIKDPRLFDDDAIDPRKMRETQYSLTRNKESTDQDDSFLPHVATIGAAAHKVYDARTPQKIPGGDKIRELMGPNTPTIVKHEGRLKSGEKEVKLNANDTVDQSFADLSLMSGDVSVCVVKNLKRI